MPPSRVLDQGGDTPLHCAAERGRAEVVTLLLARGANMEVVTYVSGYKVIQR